MIIENQLVYTIAQVGHHFLESVVNWPNVTHTLCTIPYIDTCFIYSIYLFKHTSKAVTGDPKRIEEVVARVDALVNPLQQYQFNPFAQDCSSSWKKVMKWFHREVEGIEAEAKRFIDESFKRGMKIFQYFSRAPLDFYLPVYNFL